MSSEPLVRASSNKSATVAFLIKCKVTTFKGEKAVLKEPVGIKDNLLLALLGHPVHLELALVLQLGNWDRKALVVDLLRLTRPEV